VSLQLEQTLCSEQKQCALSGEIINNSPQNENQQIATPFFSSLLGSIPLLAITLLF
jgi:hypothetical protein